MKRAQRRRSNQHGKGPANEDAPLCDAEAFDPPEVSMAEIEREAESLSTGQLTVHCSPGLRGADRRKLRGLGHHLQPVIQVGQAGPHVNLARAMHAALNRHELVKVKVLETCPSATPAVGLWCHRVLGAQVTQILGRTILLFRPRPDDPGIRLGDAEGSTGK